MSLTTRIQQILLSITQQASRHEQAKDMRTALARFMKHAKTPWAMKKAIVGINSVARAHVAFGARWVSPDALLGGQGGEFDACDLRAYLALATRAGVPFVPAREVLRLSEEEYGQALGPADLSPVLGTQSLQKLIGTKTPERPKAAPLPEALLQKLAHAMDGVPEGSMVRHVRAGSVKLKALAGCGVAGPRTPEVLMQENLNVGPGWIRVNGHRMVDIHDARFINVTTSTPSGHDAVFVARPWVKASTWCIGEDPNRHDTKLAGKGAWPAEWRAFIEAGTVVGVSFYYPWAGAATPENARMALEVRIAAQKIADAMTAQGALPRDFDFETYRTHPQMTLPVEELPGFIQNDPVQLAKNAEAREALARFPQDKPSCTLDFIETGDGLVLLEGGPPNTPFGSAHGCGFSGVGGPPKIGANVKPYGVAFKLMPHVSLIDLTTWVEGDHTGCICSWDEVRQLAEAAPTPRIPSI